MLRYGTMAKGRKLSVRMVRQLMHRLHLLFLQAEAQIFLPFMQIGSLTVCKKDIQHGQTLLMGKSIIYLTRIHGSSCFGLKTLGHC